MQNWQLAFRPSIKKQYRLRISDRVCFDTMSMNYCQLTIDEILVAKELDGQRSISDIIKKLRGEKADINIIAIEIALDRLFWRGIIIGYFTSRIEKPKPIINSENGFVWPVNVLWSITNKCNFACLHCYAESSITQDSPGHGILFKIARSIVNAGALAVTLTGGDPLLSPHFEEIVAYLNEKHIIVLLETNATSINEKETQVIKDYVSIVQFSIFASEASLHDSFTGIDGSFEATIRKTKELLQQNVVVMLNYIYTNDDNGEFQKFLGEYSQKVPFIKITPLESYGRARRIESKCLSNKDIAILAIFVDKLRHQYQNIGMHLPYLKIKNGIFDKICCAGLSQCYIDSHGQVFPCEKLKVKAGAIDESSLSDIWTNSRALEIIRSRKPKESRKCGKCEYYLDCKGGCIAYCFNEQSLGESDVFDPVCEALGEIDRYE